eukprot:scaffold226012_cov18-Prasinocladus_malaysianus.AAC.1
MAAAQACVRPRQLSPSQVTGSHGYEYGYRNISVYSYPYVYEYAYQPDDVALEAEYKYSASRIQSYSFEERRPARPIS